ncbi:LytTR family DNA-binding domain-containing protein [Carboxylicivirga linearis]|uniref:LytTR family transcriptional regulator n=1 Tax=Carboxylicivirga linearis TaxID=1628157 RepID=A0ABS5JUX3_9BACT|nr:LytTR family DNA-binding domain-containing protein [Carboxylicivirga linearis]MBS2098707.1 LytTR family transcriptional regulator [Carboxylicivirga linearis]
MMNSSLILNCTQQYRKINLTEVCHMYYIDGVITIELHDEEKILCCMALKEIEDKLPQEFVKINRNTIINVLFLVAFYKHTPKVTMENGRSFTVSRRNISMLVKKIKQHYLTVNS